MQPNTLYYGDNLDILREHIPAESIDLIYLDPPFNSNRNYNLIFKEADGTASPAQFEAFTDTWRWDMKAEQTLDDIVRLCPENVSKMVYALVDSLGRNDLTAYLVMMAIRLDQLHRVLKPTGSLYLHCDPTASHYLKIVMDTVFGPKNFRNEVIWKRTGSHGNVSGRMGDVTDTILYYSKSDKNVWNQLFISHRDEYVSSKFTNRDPDGRLWQSVSLRNPGVRPNLQYPYAASNGVIYHPHPNGWSCDIVRMRRYDDENRLHFPTKIGGQLRLKMYLDESKGHRLQNLWDDIPPLNSQAQERLGYPTQKPMALLERIIAASSNPGDIVLDPFCGCGTAISAAEKLGRRWIGIDITHLAISTMKSRLHREHPGVPIHVVGDPRDVGSARALFEQDPYQFQFWAAGLVDAMPRGGTEKKGADKGIDGIIPFVDGPKRSRMECIVQVKGGKVQRNQIEQLRGTIEREKAAMGLFITLNPPTSEMKTEAAAAGFFESTMLGRHFPKIQIVTIEELLTGRFPSLPMREIWGKQAQRIRDAVKHGTQVGMDLPIEAPIDDDEVAVTEDLLERFG